MRLLFLQHDPLDGPGSLAQWAQERGHSSARCLISGGEPLPALDTFDLLVSLGGPMGAYEEERYPWLVAEKEYLRQAVTAQKKILGLCLGCQLLADALGGKAFRHTCKEFGWQLIKLTEDGREWFPQEDDQNDFSAGSFLALKQHEEGSFLAFQWHGDTYTLPAEAIHLARNAACEQQAFLIGNQVLGLQFHLEWTEQMAREALAEPGVSPPPSPSVQTPDEILSNPSLFTSAKKRFFALMDRFVSGG